MRTINFTRILTLSAGFALGAAMLAAPAPIAAQQLSSNDRFDITLDHPVTIGRHLLPAGTYWVEPLNLAGGDAPVLTIRDDQGRKFQTSAMISATVENRIQPETRVILRQAGQRYYFDTIWVKGQAYGYRFSAPKTVAKR